jgi:hypothetical protein
MLVQSQINKLIYKSANLSYQFRDKTIKTDKL